MPGRSQIAYNLAGIAALVLVGAVGLAYGIDQAGRAKAPAQTAATASVTQTIGGRDLSIPQSWFRSSEQMRSGFAGEVDLALRLDLNGEHVTADVTLLPKSRARASTALLDAVYLHQFEKETLDGVPGLVGKPLKPADGYTGETVWYEPLALQPFVAKCAASPNPSRPARCLRTLQLPSGLAAIIGFDADALQHWQSLDDAVRTELGKIGAL